MSNDTLIEFDNITLHDVITIREFIDKHWQNDFYESLSDLVNLIEAHSKLKNIEAVFASRIG